MKRYLALLALLALLPVGCAHNKAVVSSTSCVGIKLSYDPTTYLPSILIGYITEDYIYVPKGEITLERDYVFGAGEGAPGAGLGMGPTGIELTGDEIRKTIRVKNDQGYVPPIK